MFEIVDDVDDDAGDGRTPEHGYNISSPTCTSLRLPVIDRYWINVVYRVIGEILSS